MSQKTSISDWDSCITYFNQLSSRINWIDAFKTQYFHFNKRPRKDQLRFSFKAWPKLLISFVNIMRGQLQAKNFSFKPHQILVLIDANPNYQQHLFPTINYLINQTQYEVVLMTQRHERNRILNILQYNNIKVDKIHGYETLTDYSAPKSFSLLKHAFTALYFVFLDIRAWLSTTLTSKWFLIPDFIYYSFVNHYYAKIYHKTIQNLAGILTANDQWLWENLVLHSAHNNGVKSLVIQHGTLSKLYYPIAADQVAVWSEADKDFLMNKCGASANEVSVKGSAYFDSLYHQFQQRRYSHLVEDTIVFFSSPFFKFNYLSDGDYEKVIESFDSLNTLAKKYGKQLLIKLHPWDETKYYQKWADQLSFTHASIHEVMDHACIAMAIKSTSILETAISGIPTFQFHPSNMPQFSDYSEEGITKTVEDKEALYYEVDRVLSSKEAYQEFINMAHRGLTRHFANLGMANQSIVSSFSDQL